MMKPKNIPTISRITIAALLGTLPSVATGQEPRTEEASPANDTVRVAARPIARGAVLTADDIAYERKINPAGRVTPHSVAAIDMDHRPATTQDQLVGWSARRMINTGEPLRAPAVISPRLVASGQTVDVVWRDGSIIVTAKGKATRAAGAGEKIAIRIDERRTVEGTVIALGKVRVD